MLQCWMPRKQSQKINKPTRVPNRAQERIPDDEVDALHLKQIENKKQIAQIGLKSVFSLMQSEALTIDPKKIINNDTLPEFKK